MDGCDDIMSITYSENANNLQCVARDKKWVFSMASYLEPIVTAYDCLTYGCGALWVIGMFDERTEHAQHKQRSKFDEENEFKGDTKPLHWVQRTNTNSIA
eukprot:305016_1